MANATAPSNRMVRRGCCWCRVVRLGAGNRNPKPLERADVLCLRALRTLRHIEFDLLVLIQ